MPENLPEMSVDYAPCSECGNHSPFLTMDNEGHYIRCGNAKCLKRTGSYKLQRQAWQIWTVINPRNTKK